MTLETHLLPHFINTFPLVMPSLRYWYPSSVNPFPQNANKTYHSEVPGEGTAFAVHPAVLYFALDLWFVGVQGRALEG